MEAYVLARVYLDSQTELAHVSHVKFLQKHYMHQTFEVGLPLAEIEGAKNITLDKSKNYVGKPIKIVLSAPGDKNSSLNEFNGIITEVAINRQSGSAGEVTFKGFAPTILLQDGLNTRSFTSQSLSDIVNTVLKAYPQNDLPSSVSCSPDPQIDFEVQYNETNFNFLTRLARQYGQWFYYDGKNVNFGKFTQKEELDLVFGSDLTQFDMSLKVAPMEFKSVAYDYVNNATTYNVDSSTINVSGLDQMSKFALQQSDSLFGQKPLSVSPYPVKSQNDLADSNTAIKTSKASALVLFTGHSNNSRVSIGSKIGVKTYAQDVQNADYGSYMVINVSHEVDEVGSYGNAFHAIPSSLTGEPINPMELPGEHPRFVEPECETQPAKVTANNDQQGFGRVQVQFYWQQGNDCTPWIRILNAHGGKSKGFQFIPEVGDEVMVAFENNNPSRPYVLGSLYNGKDNHSDRQDSDNYIKTIRTVSENEIKFYDKAGEESINIANVKGSNVITLSNSSSGGSITITANDSNGTISISSQKGITIKSGDDITIQSDKSISIQAKQNVTIQAQQNFEVDATQNATIKATQNVDIEAQVNATFKAQMQMDIEGAQLTVNGSATAQVSSSGQTSVKGAIVMIN